MLHEGNIKITRLIRCRKKIPPAGAGSTILGGMGVYWKSHEDGGVTSAIVILVSTQVMACSYSSAHDSQALSTKALTYNGICCCHLEGGIITSWSEGSPGYFDDKPAFPTTAR